MDSSHSARERRLVPATLATVGILFVVTTASLALVWVVRARRAIDDRARITIDAQARVLATDLEHRLRSAAAALARVSNALEYEGATAGGAPTVVEDAFETAVQGELNASGDVDGFLLVDEDGTVVQEVTGRDAVSVCAYADPFQHETLSGDAGALPVTIGPAGSNSVRLMHPVQAGLLRSELSAVACMDVSDVIAFDRPDHTTAPMVAALYQGDTLVAGGGGDVREGNRLVASQPIDGFDLQTAVAIDTSSAVTRWRWETAIVVGLIVVMGSITGPLGIVLGNHRIRAEEEAREHNRALEATNRALEERERERQWLVREINHRVKNNLGLIANIINLELAGNKTPTIESFQDLGQRIRAIEKLHEALYQREQPANQICIDRYLESVVDALVSTLAQAPIEKRVDIERLTMTSRDAVTLGLISTEIVTNALKYGLVDGGSLVIRGVRRDGTAVLTYENTGRPYRPGEPGLGTMLIHELTRQLNGEITLTTHDATRYRLIVPLQREADRDDE